MGVEVAPTRRAAGLLAGLACALGAGCGSEPGGEPGAPRPGGSPGDASASSSGSGESGGGESGGAGAGGDAGGAGEGGEAAGGTGGGEAAPGDTYYVSPTGNDANAGTSPEKAWRSIATALTRLSPGKRLVVRGGTYREIVAPKSLPQGEANARIVVEAYPGERPVVAGRVRLNRPSYWTWSGVHVTRDPETSDAAGDLVHLRDGVGWVFRRSEVWGGHGYANVTIAGGKAHPGEPGNFRFAENCVHDVAKTHDVTDGPGTGFPDHNVYVNFGATKGAGGVLERNLFFGAPNGSGVKVGAGDEASPDPANVVVRYNTFYDGARAMVLAHESANVSIVRNLMVKATGGVTEQQPGVTPLVYVYHLDGAGNSFEENYGWDASVFVHHQPPNTKTLVNGGGNAFGEANPVLDASHGCAGFSPSHPKAKLYGRHAP